LAGVVVAVVVVVDAVVEVVDEVVDGAVVSVVLVLLPGELTVVAVEPLVTGCGAEVGDVGSTTGSADVGWV
jgi:hypothetical protein